MTWIRRHRSLLLLALLALLVLLPRGAYIASVHSESIDDEYHLVRGIRFLKGDLGRSPLNDPTLGETIMALPLWLADAVPNRNYRFGLILHNQKVSVETLTMSVAIWKSILFVPCVLLAFIWVRRLYNERAAWVAAAILLIEPTISAHVTPGGLDVFGFEAILIGCFCWWSYFEKQTWLRLILAASVSGAAMLVKHTAIIMPLVALCYATAWWVYRWRIHSRQRAEGAELAAPQLRPLRDVVHALCAMLVAAVALTFLSGGFVEVRRPDSIPADSLLGKLFEYRLPAGYYIKSLQTAAYHGAEGHPSWLLGKRNDSGSLLYYPIVALYKVPIALLLFIAAGVLSLIKVRPRFGEVALLVPMVLLLLLITKGGINIGFRHAIPAYTLLLMLCCRTLLVETRWVLRAALTMLAVTVIDTARYFPNLISYINFPRDKVWMDVNDSNLDWGQALKQIRDWVNFHGKLYSEKPIGVRYFGLDYSPNVEYYLKDTRATRVPRNAGPPDRGILIISPVYVAGMFEKEGLYDFLRTEEPIDVIGDSNLVFDLDEIYARRPEARPRPSTTQPDRPE